MSKLEEQFELDLPVDQARLVCRRAVLALGWGIDVLEPHRIVPKRGFGLTRNPSKVEILIAGAGDCTRIMLHGSIAGIGPVQRKHLQRTMTRVRLGVEVEAANAAQQIRHDQNGS